MTTLSIFCGANTGSRPEYEIAALKLVEAMVEREITLVYGGGNTGLMGKIANHALSSGGKVVGVIPHQLLDMEMAHTGLSELHTVKSMSERKQKMNDLSDGCIALPGGTGTLDELFDEIVLTQIGYHNKPAGLLNTCNYYQHLICFLEHACTEGYINQTLPDILTIDKEPELLLNAIQQKL